jgi:DeoR/GlpR family transcriptional regulator of sugar metabolism
MHLLASESGPNVELIGVGGTLRALTSSFVGAAASRTVNEHYGDRLFLSAKGVVDNDTLTDADALEADVKRTMIGHVRVAVLLIDASKLNVRGLVAIAPLSQVATVLAAGVSSEQAAALRRGGTVVEVVRGVESAGSASPASGVSPS